MKYPIKSAAFLLLAAGSALAQPVLDGKIDPADTAFYGAAKWVQTNPTTFGDNATTPPCSGFGTGIRVAVNNSNSAGVTGGTGAASGAGVTTGVEIAIPLSQLGNPTGSIKIAGFIVSGDHGFLSNQIIGGLPDGYGNLADPRGLNFAAAAFPNNQFVEVPAALPECAASIEFDGTLDGAYGAALWTQTLQTQFGDSNISLIDYANGSEIDGVYGFICDADLDGDMVSEPVLFVFVTGNVESNGNHLALFFDTAAGGQNRLRGDNPDVSFNQLNRMGDSGGPNGLTFDAGFESDYFYTFSCYYSEPAMGFRTFSSFAETLQDGGGQGANLGSGGSGNDELIVTNPCPPAIPNAGLSYGSELNAVYSYIDEPNNKLYVHITGNLQSASEQHRLHLFFDANGNPLDDEGQNSILGNNPEFGIADGDGGVINRLGDNGVDPGLTFDAGFASDYYLVFHYEEANGSRSVADGCILRTTGRDAFSGTFSKDYGAFQGKAAGTLITFDGSNFCCTPANGIQLQDGATVDIYTAFAPREAGDVLAAFYAFYPDQIDWTATNWDAWVADNATGPQAGKVQAVLSNRNVGGVTSSDASGAAGATEGFEFVIDLDELGWDGVTEIRLAGLIGNQSATYMSNQVLGGLPTGAGNLEEPRLINFDSIAGNQFVVLNPAGVGYCDADWCQDGSVGVPDIFCFLADWFDSVPAAVNYGGTPGVPAIFAFLAEWFATPQGPCTP